MAPIFDREEALASPYPPVGPIGSLALEFALLGHIDLARDLIAVLNHEYPMHGLDMALRQLQLAWQASGKWPEGSPKFESHEEREEFEQELDAELWPDEIEEDDCTADEAGLKRLLELADAVDGQGEEADDEDLDAQVELTKSICLAKALDISIQLAEGEAGKASLDRLDDRSKDVLHRIAERMHCNNQSEALASSVHAWPYLAKGVLADAAGAKSDKLESLGKTIKETITEWFSRGPRAWSQSEKSLKDLLEICSNRSKEFWEDEFDEPAPKTLFASSGASEQEIGELEKKLDTKLPADYKEFLGFSNGFKQVIADGIFEDFEAPLHSTSEISWRKADELMKNVEEDEDDDDDDDEPKTDEAQGQASKESRPAKKIKLADGAEAATKEAGDGDDEDEEVTGLEWLGEHLNVFNIELLPLPSAAHLSLVEENEGEWPEIEKVLEVGGGEGSYLWLLPPDQVRKARDAYVKTLDGTDDEQLKKVIRWAMVAFAGSEEAFRKLDDWVFIAWSNGQMHTWTNFRRYVEELADTCQKLEKVEDEEKAAKEETLAYSCR